ncbi:dynein regulatory complex protein 1-like [Scleropages formosus]|uniref:dynein regulatory complex protein 1-like n=1 Tax=Scleropages formosus TaxID=113540 RepID=UPI0010FABDB2|nr:dynein regulatory complex protein 1-like [Scleropages formosus]
MVNFYFNKIMSSTAWEQQGRTDRDEEKRRKTFCDESKDMKDPEDKKRSQKQMESSKKRVAKVQNDGTVLVTNIRVAADFREAQRRAEQKEASRRRIEKLEMEAKTSLEKFEEISRRWTAAREKDVPQELREALNQQQQLCAVLLEDKNRLIKDLHQQLKANDDRYVKDLKKQAEHVDLMIERMEEQIKNLMRCYREELDQIEKVFSEERKELLSSNRRVWEQMAHERRDKELDFLVQRMRKVEECEILLQKLRMEDEEEYNMVKIKLDNDVQTLEQQLQQMKATYQLNQEKLEYNFQVLKKRDEENIATKSQQKRKITRLQDAINNLKMRCAKQEKQAREENQSLSDDYQRVMQQYRDVHQKMRHFVTTDAKKFDEIWLMNEAEVKELAEKALQINRLVHEQQLALPWVRPALPSMGQAGRRGAPTMSQQSRNLSSPERSEVQTAAYWQTMASIIPESKLKVWGALESALGKYYTVLNERSELLVETQNLQQQNMELKMLLHQYLSSKVNAELVVPPTRLMQLNKNNFSSE